MADDFQGSDNITIWPGDTMVPYRFQVTVATSSNKNDGHIPYGSSVIKVDTYEVFSERGTTLTDVIASAPTLDGNTIVVPMNWSTDMKASKDIYHLRMKIVCTRGGSTVNAFKKKLRFNRIYGEPNET